MPCKERRQSKISLKQNDVVSFDSKKNVNSILENSYFKNVNFQKTNVKLTPLKYKISKI